MSDLTSSVKPSARAQKKANPASPMAQFVLRIFGMKGACVGLVWIAFLIVLATFAPFIANSHPFIWHVEGETSYPLFANLGKQDAWWLSIFIGGVAVAVAALFTPLKHSSGAIFVWIMIVALSMLVLRVPLLAENFDALQSVFNKYEQVDTSGMTTYALELFEKKHSADVRRAMGIIIANLALLTILLSVVVSMFIYLFADQSRRMMGAFAGVLAVLFVTMLAVWNPSSTSSDGFEAYRIAIADEAVEASGVFTLIPYSPADYQPDIGRDTKYLPPSWVSLFNQDATPDRGEGFEVSAFQHLLGTAAGGTGGADIASRMIHATRVVLTVGLLATGLSLIIGIVVGGLMGYYSGPLDLLGMRVVEVFSALPVIVLLITICAIYDRNIYLMMVIIGLTGWVGYAIFIRSEFLRLRNADYIQAARAMGAPLWSILFKHMLPNGVTPVLVLAPFGVAAAILFESTLSFLGLGLLAQDPSWGQLLEEARQTGANYWWLVIFPGLAIFLTVFAYNLIGEAMRVALDPRAQR